jgi:LIVCS family branched-chain amino acid:cation transporter
VVVLTIRPSKVIDILGKYLTPVLVAAITVLIIVGVINPAAPAGPQLSETLFRDGIYNGYQTLDVMAGLFFSILVIDAIRGRNAEAEGAAGGVVGEEKAAARAALLAGGLLCFVYGGLTYLGATTGAQWTDAYQAGEINQAGLLINIAQALLGKVGVGVLSIIVALACLTTAIGLTSAAAEYFSGLVMERRSKRVGDAAVNGAAETTPGSDRVYAVMILLVYGVSLALSNFGLSTIIGIAAPVLMLFYPTVMFLTMATLFRGKLRKQNIYRLGAGVSFLISALTVLADTCGISACGFIHQLPLDAYGFNWLIPALIAAVIGYFLPGGEIED